MQDSEADKNKMGPPPWSEAPECATHRAMDSDGGWLFYRGRPERARVGLAWAGRACGLRQPYMGDAHGRGWVETCESRPTDDDWVGHVSPCAGHSYEDEPPEIDTETLRMFHEGVKSGEVNVVADAPGYECLRRTLDDAYEQAAYGKGAERHGNSHPFDRQPMQHLISDHGLGFATGQAAKKASEALGMDHGAARRELLGAIVYLAGAIVWMDRQEEA